MIAILPRDGTMIPDLVSGNITAAADGAFVVRGLLPGSYDLIARLPAPLGGDRRTDRSARPTRGRSDACLSRSAAPTSTTSTSSCTRAWMSPAA